MDHEDKTGADGTAIARHDQGFILQTVQPGLLGLVDGFISTLAPLFAAAIATGSSRPRAGNPRVK